jgi:hypothetical protein
MGWDEAACVLEGGTAIRTNEFGGDSAMPFGFLKAGRVEPVCTSDVLSSDRQLAGLMGIGRLLSQKENRIVVGISVSCTER